MHYKFFTGDTVANFDSGYLISVINKIKRLCITQYICSVGNGGFDDLNCQSGVVGSIFSINSSSFYIVFP